VTEEKFIMFRNRLAKVFRHLNRQAKRLNVSCFRVYDHDLPEFPFCIEKYEDKLYVAEYRRRHGLTDEEHDQWIRKSIEVIREVFETGPENIFLKLRKRKEGRSGQYKAHPNPAAKAGLWETSLLNNEFIVYENRLKFIVNLSDYLDTGLFLDHRITREMVKKDANGKKVLNLFCYTGSFSVYAAAGGADEVVSVDLSKTYLDWAERNMQLNGFANYSPPAGGDGGKYKFVHADVKQYLKTVSGSHFDMVILDPPTFSNSQRMDDFLDIQKDHVGLINDCLHALRKDGVVYFSTNFRKFALNEERINAASIKDIRRLTTPFDFEGRLFRSCFKITKDVPRLYHPDK
jgi:23S rRNA (cytosine1962-C5)-methyltransferase